MGEGIVLSMNGAGIAEFPHVKERKFDPYITPYTKITQNGSTDFFPSTGFFSISG